MSHSIKLAKSRSPSFGKSQHFSLCVDVIYNYTTDCVAIIYAHAVILDLNSNDEILVSDCSCQLTIFTELFFMKYYLIINTIR